MIASRRQGTPWYTKWEVPAAVLAFAFYGALVGLLIGRGRGMLIGALVGIAFFALLMAYAVSARFLGLEVVMPEDWNNHAGWEASAEDTAPAR